MASCRFPADPHRPYIQMEEKRCKICGRKYIVLGLDVLERCVECIDKLEIKTSILQKVLCFFGYHKWDHWPKNFQNCQFCNKGRVILRCKK